MRKRYGIVIMLLLVATSLFARGHGETVENEMLIDVDRLEALIGESRITILDIRDQASYRKGHIPGAELLTLVEIEQRGTLYIDLGNPIVTYCSCPAEESSLSAALKLRDLGADTIYVLLGGYAAWEGKRNPIVTGSNPN